MASPDKPLREGFYRVELNKAVWEVPSRYQDLNAIGTGAYGTVWLVQTSWTIRLPFMHALSTMKVSVTFRRLPGVCKYPVRYMLLRTWTVVKSVGTNSVDWVW